MTISAPSIARAAVLSIFTFVLALGGCGDDGGGASDAGMARNFSLEILEPPGDSIGLVFSGSTTLRVRYLDDERLPLTNHIIDFHLLDSGAESTGGASLSSTEAITDADGIATIDLVAGAERVNYRVEASAAQATSVLFYIQVSDLGFVNLQIRSAHEGPRDPTMYEKLQLRIYASSPVRCSEIDFDELPESFLQPRTQGAIGEVSEFVNLAADDAYTVVAWAEIAGGRPLATACLNLPAERLRSGQTFSAVLSLVDRAYEFEQALALEATIELSPLTDSLVGARAWRQLACPLGHAELLLDCLADAQNSDGDMDCDGMSTSLLSTTLATRRGILDSEGCRLPLDSEGSSSIDALLQNALDAGTGGWPSTVERSALSDGYQSLTRELQLSSILTPASSTAATHRLLEASLGSESTDLLASNRPVVEATGVPYKLSAAPLLSLGEHAFTLRYGDLASEHYEALVLEPANVSGLQDTLGDEFISGVAIASDSGCSALEAFVCSNLSLPAACANQCSSIASDLNTLLAGWLPGLASSGIDFELSFDADIGDDNRDLRVDTLSADYALDAAAIRVTITTDIDSQVLPAELTATAATAATSAP